MSIVDNIPAFADEGNVEQFERLTPPINGALNVSAASEGRKETTGKPKLDLIPDLALEEVAKVLMFGAKKYDPYNWAKGLEWSEVIGAIKRHTGKFNRGIDIDEESGIVHTAHIACDALFLTEYWLRSLGKDNRHKWNK